MFQRATLICAALLAVNAYPQNPFFSFSSGGPPSPFSNGGPPPSFGGGGGSPFGKGGPLASFSSGGPPSSSPFSSGGPPSSSPFSSGNGPPPSSPFGNGPLGRPGNRPKNSPGNKLFSWLGSTMSKLQGLGPKISYYPPKPKPSSLGGPSLGSSGQNAPPTYFSSGGPPRQPLGLSEIPNSIFETSSSPYNGGSTVTFASPSHSNSIDHPPVAYRNPSGPPRPGPPPPRFASPRPPFGSRPPPPSFSSGGPSPFSSSPYASSRPPFGGPSFSSSQNTRNNLEVFPSQQISYQSQTLSQNEPGYNNAFGSLQSLYGSQSKSKPSYFQNQQGPSNYEQQSSYSQAQPQVSNNAGNNYGATFHSVEPVRVAPIYDVGQHFKPASSDLSGAGSNHQQTQQQSNIHDTPFVTLVNEYAAHADAATSSSEQMMTALQGASDLATAASTNGAIPGVQIMGQNPDGNPMFEVVADANAPTYDGHPVDLNKLISMIEPGAQIDTMPSYNSDAQMGSSEQQPIYAQAPSHLELESDAAMASGIMSGNKDAASKKSQTRLHTSSKIRFNNINDKLNAVVASASESRPTVVKLDGTRLNDEKLIKEHFDKEIILDDLQENKDHGFIIVGVHTDNDTGDQDEDEYVHGTNKNWTLIDSFDSSNNNENIKTDHDMLALVQLLRNSAIVNRLKNDSGSLVVTAPLEPNSTTDSTPTNNKEKTTSSQHPNHNYYPELAPKEALKETNEHDSETRVPVINPIFDSVRPSSVSDVDSDNSNNSTSLELKTDIDHDNVQLIADNADDEDQFYPDDMIMGTDGDLAASGSRNVKSVAIIVTPPPNYVKIRNKYKKTITPLSAMTSTTPMSTSLESGSPPPTSSSSNSESIKSNNFNNSSIGGSSEERSKNIIMRNSDSSISTSSTTVATHSSLQSNLGNSSSSNNNNDSIVNDSTITSGIDVGHLRQYDNNNRTLLQNNKQTRRYPVYRGRNNNA